jgi:ELWxxDGT repeat protein
LRTCNHTKSFNKEATAMKSRISILYVVMLCVFGLIFLGCGSESTSGSSGNNIGGIASKGIISGAVAKAYGVNADGSKGAELGSDQTDADGKYSIDLGDYNGPIIVEVVGGSYEDEATGTIKANIKLRAVVPNAKGNTKAAVTPLTEMAVQLAGSIFTVSRINNVNAKVAVLIGGADITETQPPDIRDDLGGATTAEKDYTMVLAAISQMIEDGSAPDVANVVAMISNDLADDGKLEVNGSGAGDLLQGALGNFVESADNKTGLTSDDITLDDDLAEAANLDAIKFVMSKQETSYDDIDFVYEVENYTYEKCENLLEIENDGYYQYSVIADGVVDTRRTMAYNENGSIVTKTFESNIGVFADSLLTYTYDAEGKLINTSGAEHSGGPRTIFYTYNAKDQLVQENHHIKSSGQPLSQYFYAYDENGNRIKTDTDWDMDNIVDQRTTYTYDANGKPMGYADSDAPDFIPTALTSYSFTYTYDESGNLIRKDKRNGNNGLKESHIYEYDVYGNRTLEKIDWDGDGTFDEQTTYTYEACTLPSAPNLFAGSDGVNGVELWITDGTGDGTYMLKDIEQSGVGSNPYSDSYSKRYFSYSFPSEFVTAGNKAFFWAYTETFGYELWVSDGTEAGTHMVKDLWPGTNGNKPYSMGAYKGRLYFDVNTGGAYQMHVSDGTEAGTRLFHDRDGNQLSGSLYFSQLGDKLLFRASNDGSNYELFISDGTEAGTYMLKDIYPGAASSFMSSVTVIGDKLYFTADDGFHNNEPWVSDGTEAGTHIIADLNPGNISSNSKYFVDAGDGKAIFRADATQEILQTTQLWITDGTEAGTQLLVDPDTLPYGYESVFSYNGKVYFDHYDDVNGTEIWETAGTVGSTKMFIDLNPGAESSNANFLTVFDGKLYFTADNGTYGKELWITDGTVQGTRLVKDINPGAGSSFPWDIWVYEDKLYFAADDGTNGAELWVSDGTEAGTHITIDANPGLGAGYIGMEEN